MTNMPTCDEVQTDSPRVLLLRLRLGALVRFPVLYAGSRLFDDTLRELVNLEAPLIEQQQREADRTIARMIHDIRYPPPT